MAYKLKIVKTKEFTVEGKDHTHFSVAYKGRVFGTSTLVWESEPNALKVEGDNLTLTGDIEVIKRETPGDVLTGQPGKTFFDIVPKSGLTLAAF